MSQSPSPAGPGALSDADRRLVEACLTGEAGAWVAFVDRFAGLFAHVADRAARHRHTPLAAADREDLVAEIVLECLRNDAAVLRGFRGRSSLPTYLTVIARRIAVRRLVRDFEAFRLPLVGEPGEPAAADEPARIEDREQIETLLDRLEPDEARLVQLHHLEARSYGEISQLTGLPLGSIGPALSRARAKLRVMMEPRQAG
ncbi:MAG: RNA polymerase sigma factor [Planctomycetes bacterium]|nr:RNA polymerase sigma factor [Planctomycetota bacterium]MBM4057313.1 RNA polymerase sigma factor [Planctomycetota bacterium]